MANDSSLTIVPSDLNRHVMRPTQVAPLGLLCERDWAIFGLWCCEMAVTRQVSDEKFSAGQADEADGCRQRVGW
jgi:hypothetical protein